MVHAIRRIAWYSIWRAWSIGMGSMLSARRRAIAAFLIVVGGFERLVSWLSGAVAEDTGRALTNVRSVVEKIPLLGNPTLQTLLLIAGVALLIWESKWRQRGLAFVLREPSVMPSPAIKCTRCKGTGCDWGDTRSSCPKCKATGELPGEIAAYPICKPCKGTGRAWADTRSECTTCGGFGHRLPPGIAEELMQKFFRERHLA